MAVTSGATESGAGETTTSESTTTAASASMSSTSVGGCEDDFACEPGTICLDGRCQPPENALCGHEFVVLIPIIYPEAVLIVDTSASMVESLVDHDGDPNTPGISRWELLREGLAVELPKAVGVRWGLVRMPGDAATSSHDASACLMSDAADVPIGEVDNVAAILAALPPSDATAATIQGATPLTAALSLASALPGSEFGAPRFAILFTDGAANCSADAGDADALLDVYDPAAVAAAQALYEGGLPTFVVGVDVVDAVTPVAVDLEADGVNLHDFLNELAFAGGAPKADPDDHFWSIRNAADLAEFFAKAVIGEPEGGSPLIDLDEPVPPTFTIRVVVGGVDYGTTPVRDCTYEDGWIFDDPERSRVQLCGSAAELFFESADLVITYICPRTGG
jgi:hypothetical protein